MLEQNWLKFKQESGAELIDQSETKSMTRSQTGANEFSVSKEYEMLSASMAYEKTHEILREEYSKINSLK